MHRIVFKNLAKIFILVLFFISFPPISFSDTESETPVKHKANLTLPDNVQELIIEGKYYEAIEIIREDLSDPDSDLNKNLTVKGDVLFSLAVFYEMNAEETLALELYDEALKTKKEDDQDNENEIAEIYHNIAYIKKSTGSYSEAEKYYIKSISLKEKVYSTDHPNTLKSLKDLGVFYLEQKDFESAKKILEKLNAIESELYSKNSLNRLNTLQLLVEIYINLNKSELSNSMLEEIIRIKEKHYGKNDIKVAESLDFMGMRLLSQSKFEKAEEILLKSLEMKEKNKIGNEDSLIKTLENLAYLYTRQNLNNQAKKYFTRANLIKDQIK